MTRRDWLAAAAIAVVALAALAIPHLTKNDLSARLCLNLSTPDVHDGMVWVPAGTYAQGDTVYPEEGPVTAAHVNGFWMDRHEVTNGEFAAFVAATGYVTVAEQAIDPATHGDLPGYMYRAGAVVFFMPKNVQGMDDISQWWRYTPGANWRHPAGPMSSIAGRENYPVVEVTHEDALAYARWKHRALPTEVEWEWAARAGHAGAGDDHDQPKNANTWQGIFPVLNSGDDGFVGLAPVGCYGANAYELFDMFGNVWELTDDIYRPRHGEALSPERAPTIADDIRYVIKGGSFLCAPNYCMRYRSGAREGQEATLAMSHVGFRTILRASQSAGP